MKSVWCRLNLLAVETEVECPVQSVERHGVVSMSAGWGSARSWLRSGPR